MRKKGGRREVERQKEMGGWRGKMNEFCTNSGLANTVDTVQKKVNSVLSMSELRLYCAVFSLHPGRRFISSDLAQYPTTFSFTRNTEPCSDTVGKQAPPLSTMSDITDRTSDETVGPNLIILPGLQLN